MTAQQTGDLIRQRREFLKLRQEDLAELSAVTVKTINSIEQGKANPAFRTLNKIATVLGLEIQLTVKKINE